MGISDNKKRVTITIPKEKYIQLKKLALDKNTTLSKLVLAALKTYDSFK